MRFKKVVNAVEYLALAAALFTLVMLFAYNPSEGMSTADGGGGGGTEVSGEAVYEKYCGGCHGVDGEGLYGPQLSDGKVVASFPDAKEQIAVVTDGRGGMPAFDSRLDAAQIEAVVEYTRGL